MSVATQSGKSDAFLRAVGPIASLHDTKCDDTVDMMQNIAECVQQLSTLSAIERASIFIACFNTTFEFDLTIDGYVRLKPYIEILGPNPAKSSASLPDKGVIEVNFRFVATDVSEDVYVHGNEKKKEKFVKKYLQPKLNMIKDSMKCLFEMLSLGDTEKQKGWTLVVQA